VPQNHPELQSTGFASNIDYHAVPSLAPPLAQLKKNACFFVDLAHNLYRLVEPTLEMTPSHGRTKEGGVVVKSSCPPNSKWPVALAKRPVPPVTSVVSKLSYTPGVSVGHRYPSKVP